MIDEEYFRDPVKIDNAIYLAKEFYEENEPYVLEHRMEGNVVIFNKHFIDTILEAFMNGCLAKMNGLEEELFFQFVDYEDQKEFRDISVTNDNILRALDQWLVNMSLGRENPYINECWK